MGISVANIILILIVVLIVFGAGKLPKVMGDLGKGVKNFRDGINNLDNEEEPAKLEDKSIKKKKNARKD